MEQSRFNDIYSLIKEAQDAQKTTELHSKLRQMQTEMEREVRHSRVLHHPEEVCPECGGAKGKDVFVCDDCWHTKDQDRLQREHE